MDGVRFSCHIHTFTPVSQTKFILLTLPTYVGVLSTSSGTIPPELGGLRALQKLGLRENQLTGERQ